MTYKKMRISLWVALGCLFFAACAGPREATETRPDPEPGETLPTPVQLSDYEDFDPGPYREAPLAEAELEHDVPDELMEGRADENVARTVQGFRIQITQTQDKASADDVLEEALAWWQEQADEPNAPASFRQAQPPVYILYRQPYYRVRVGNFTSREEANRFIRYVKQRFPSALVVPDAVTVRQ